MKTALVIADSHIPFHEEGVLNIYRKLGKDLKPDYLVMLGDMVDANGLSKFTLKDYETGFFDTIKEIEQFKTDYLEPLIGSIANNKLIKIIN